jgi:hypothetical protein
MQRVMAEFQRRNMVVGLCECALLPCRLLLYAGAESESSLSTSPERTSTVHFALGSSSSMHGSEGGRAHSHVKRSISMAELAAAELVRQEDVALDSQESMDGGMLEKLAASSKLGLKRSPSAGGRSV